MRRAARCDSAEGICANGLLDLNAGVPLPITSSFLTMNAVDYAYDPMAECPRWEKFIADVLPNDADAQRELRKAFGYALSGDTSQQKIFGFFGKLLPQVKKRRGI